eukprot:360488-Chlamydomonas_euryale.AAC.2
MDPVQLSNFWTAMVRAGAGAAAAATAATTAAGDGGVASDVGAQPAAAASAAAPRVALRFDRAGLRNPELRNAPRSLSADVLRPPPADSQGGAGIRARRGRGREAAGSPRAADAEPARRGYGATAEGRRARDGPHTQVGHRVIRGQRGAL